MHETVTGKTFRWLFIVLAAVATIFPFYWAISLATQSTAESFGKPKFFHAMDFSAFKAVWHDAEFLNSLMMSLMTVLTTVLITLAVTVPAAYVLTRYDVKAKTPLIGWMLIAYLLPDFLVAIPMYALLQNVGLYDTPLGLALAYQVFMTPLAMWLLLQFFDEVPSEIAEAASIDGASTRQVLIRVYLPIVRPGIATTAVLVAIMVWNEVTIALALTLQNTTVPVAVASYKGYASVQWDQLAAASLLAMLPIVVFAMFAQKHIVAGLAAGVGK